MMVTNSVHMLVDIVCESQKRIVILNDRRRFLSVYVGLLVRCPYGFATVGGRNIGYRRLPNKFGPIGRSDFRRN